MKYYCVGFISLLKCPLISSYKNGFICHIEMTTRTVAGSKKKASFGKLTSMADESVQIMQTGQTKKRTDQT